MAVRNVSPRRGRSGADRRRAGGPPSSPLPGHRRHHGPDHPLVGPASLGATDEGRRPGPRSTRRWRSTPPPRPVCSTPRRRTGRVRRRRVAAGGRRGPGLITTGGSAGPHVAAHRAPRGCSVRSCSRRPGRITGTGGRARSLTGLGPDEVFLPPRAADEAGAAAGDRIVVFGAPRRSSSPWATSSRSRARAPTGRVRDGPAPAGSADHRRPGLDRTCWCPTWAARCRRGALHRRGPLATPPEHAGLEVTRPSRTLDRRAGQRLPDDLRRPSAASPSSPASC